MADPTVDGDRILQSADKKPDFQVDKSTKTTFIKEQWKDGIYIGDQPASYNKAKDLPYVKTPGADMSLSIHPAGIQGEYFIFNNAMSSKDIWVNGKKVQLNGNNFYKWTEGNVSLYEGDSSTDPVYLNLDRKNYDLTVQRGEIKERKPGARLLFRVVEGKGYGMPFDAMQDSGNVVVVGGNPTAERSATGNEVKAKIVQEDATEFPEGQIPNELFSIKWNPDTKSLTLFNQAGEQLVKTDQIGLEKQTKVSTIDTPLTITKDTVLETVNLRITIKIADRNTSPPKVYWFFERRKEK